MMMVIYLFYISRLHQVTVHIVFEKTVIEPLQSTQALKAEMEADMGIVAEGSRFF
jgi:hypothetical protein